MNIRLDKCAKGIFTKVQITETESIHLAFVTNITEMNSQNRISTIDNVSVPVL